MSVLQPYLDMGFYPFKDNNNYISMALFENLKRETPLHVAKFSPTG